MFTLRINGWTIECADVDDVRLLIGMENQVKAKIADPAQTHPTMKSFTDEPGAYDSTLQTKETTP